MDLWRSIHQKFLSSFFQDFTELKKVVEFPINFINIYILIENFVVFLIVSQLRIETNNI